ncbi:hypothetical protein LXA43DRAFT_419669 [Ganoderma leucocontextum]|nr:hypothetical protein LXA43DRAFT_419669 [Ganoderma leucocontextum]
MTSQTSPTEDYAVRRGGNRESRGEVACVSFDGSFRPRAWMSEVRTQRSGSSRSCTIIRFQCDRWSHGWDGLEMGCVYALLCRSGGACRGTIYKTRTSSVIPRLIFRLASSPRHPSYQSWSNYCSNRRDIRRPGLALPANGEMHESAECFRCISEGLRSYHCLDRGSVLKVDLQPRFRTCAHRLDVRQRHHRWFKSSALDRTIQNGVSLV